MQYVEYSVKGATDHQSYRLKPVAPPVAGMNSVKLLTAAVAVDGFREILNPAARTLPWTGFGLDRLSAPWAELRCWRKVFIAF
jgi:hypothetical protein